MITTRFQHPSPVFYKRIQKLYSYQWLDSRAFASPVYWIFIFTRNHLSWFAKSCYDLFRFLAMTLVTSASSTLIPFRLLRFAGFFAFSTFSELVSSMGISTVKVVSTPFLLSAVMVPPINSTYLFCIAVCGSFLSNGFTLALPCIIPKYRWKPVLSPVLPAQPTKKKDRSKSPKKALQLRSFALS